MMKSILCAVAISAVAFSTSAATVANGDFETGDLTGWTLGAAGQGETGIAEVNSFDTDGSGASNAANFRVGRERFTPSFNQGITLTQTVSILTESLYSFTADVAALGGSTNLNASGGLFELLIGGVLIDTFDADQISSGEVKRDALAGKVQLGIGDVDLTIRMTRQYTQNDTTPQQFVDNVAVEDLLAVPLPASLPFLAVGLGGLAVFRRKS